MKKRNKPVSMKPRKQYLYATTKGSVSEIRVDVGPGGAIRFGTEMINVRIETSYDRLKKPKTINRIGLEPDRMYLDANIALYRNYDRLFAVDTNTRAIKGHRVSVTSVLEVLPVQGDGSSPFEPLFFLEFLDVTSNPEPLGWIIAAKNITRFKRYQSLERLAMIVDSEESKIPAYNARTLPVYRDVALPDRVTLVYATTDTGSEYLVNAVIRHADYMAVAVLDEIENGHIPMNEPHLTADRGYAGIRTIRVEKLDDDESRPDLAHCRLWLSRPTQ